MMPRNPRRGTTPRSPRRGTAAAVQAATPTERYRLERSPVSRECGNELTRITGDIDDPIVKLRYLQRALNQDDKGAALVDFVPIPPARRAWYRLKGLLALDSVADQGAVVADRTLAARKTARRIVVGVTASLLLKMNKAMYSLMTIQMLMGMLGLLKILNL